MQQYLARTIMNPWNKKSDFAATRLPPKKTRPPSDTPIRRKIMRVGERRLFIILFHATNLSVFRVQSNRCNMQ